MPRRNAWQLAEHLGELNPDEIQRLFNLPGRAPANEHMVVGIAAPGLIAGKLFPKP